MADVRLVGVTSSIRLAAVVLFAAALCCRSQTLTPAAKKQGISAVKTRTSTASQKAGRRKPTTTKKSRSTATSKTKAMASEGVGHHNPRGSYETVYRTGHGNHGLGTTRPAPRYSAPLVEASPSVRPTVAGAAAIEFASHLDSFFGRLQASEAGGDSPQTTRILQFGDSHTAADMLTGRMRSLFQARFGDGGAGFTYAGHPFAGYRILGTSRSQSTGWITEGVRFTKIQDTQLGLGGVANTSTGEGDSVAIDAPCKRMELQYLDQPGGGSFSLLEDGQPLANIATDDTGSQSKSDTLTVNCAPGATHHFEVVAQSSAPVRLLGFVTEQPGITYEALGLNGAEASLMTRWNQPIFDGYLRQRDPALIVLAYGTNEASDHNWTYEAYRSLLGRLVDQLHATVPDASILVVGPPDRSIRVGRAGRKHTYSWRTFDETLHITEAQRDTCKTHGCAFWSWRERMGGLGSMNQWAADGLAQGDHVHFTSRGYVQLADYLYSDIIAAYTAWKTTSPSATDPVASRGISPASAVSPNP